MNTKEDDAIIKGQSMVIKHLQSFLIGVAIRCAIELKIVDIINNQGVPLTLTQIAHEINSPTLNLDGLSRLMRFLVRKQIIDEVHKPECIESLYALNYCSKWLIQDERNSLAPFAMMTTDPILYSPLVNFKQSIVEGSTTFMKTYGVEMWDIYLKEPRVSRILNEAMACFTRITMDAILSSYDFHGVKGILVDIGGGIGTAINDIVINYPHIKGINFDLPHVISDAPTYEGVTHVEGDMFKAIPPANSYFIKLVLHNWGDDKCVEILKNCRDSIIEKTGRVIIVDIILNPEEDGVFDDTHYDFDLVMLASCNIGGRERTEIEWKTILEAAGFHHYKVFKIPAVVSIIEAYLD
ncbi:desmethylxanthohumol 6'-O-methyltransferase-like isoform X1 [Rutidosis leptorrhynchoides]|uniref:desmethylxanthohumol 6'-O-methyltransferase-like isoform X1 n=1 Tax=Rutidosis leptorrhynchoides TaxID=125765 RepID=UPI003A9A5791